MVTYATNRRGEAKNNPNIWFAHSASHGWVMLDRRLPENVCTTIPAEFLFTRCRDGFQYQQGAQPWNYRSADRYVESLPMKDAMDAEQELEEFMEAFAA